MTALAAGAFGPFFNVVEVGGVVVGVVVLVFGPFFSVLVFAVVGVVAVFLVNGVCLLFGSPVVAVPVFVSLPCATVVVLFLPLKIGVVWTVFCFVVFCVVGCPDFDVTACAVACGRGGVRFTAPKLGANIPAVITATTATTVGTVARILKWIISKRPCFAMVDKYHPKSGQASAKS